MATIKETKIRPIEVSHAYNINSTCFVVEATYSVDLALSKSLIKVLKAAEDPIPTNHKDLLALATGKLTQDYDPHFDPLYAEVKTRDQFRMNAGTLDENGETITFAYPDNVNEVL